MYSVVVVVTGFEPTWTLPPTLPYSLHTKAKLPEHLLCIMGQIMAFGPGSEAKPALLSPLYGSED